jgi:glycosyltransferase involved in cell wall biosynthesis
MNSANNPLVSVIIPTYNAQDWIVSLLRSIENQSYQNIEVILLNDGSTDETVALIEKFASGPSQRDIHLINQKNSGVSSARNEGVRHSRGELIAFVDSDDIWLEDKIEKQVNVMSSLNLDATACSYAIFADSNLEILDLVHPDWSSQGVQNWLLFRSYGGLLSSTLMMRKDVFYKTGLFRTDLSLSADIEFAWRLLSVTNVELIREPLVGYRLRPNQMHKHPDLLLSESKRMLDIIDLLHDEKFARVFLANLNLRLFLYQIQKFDFRMAIYFFVESIRNNTIEMCVTLLRITIRRIRRKFQHIERSSFLLPKS